jgi:hypothetical protein
MTKDETLEEVLFSASEVLLLTWGGRIDEGIGIVI